MSLLRRAFPGGRALFLGAWLASAGLAHGQMTADYHSLYNRVEEYTNLNVETTRGLALNGIDLYALNTHAGLLSRFSFATFPPVRTDWPTALSPIAVSVWNGRVLVLGGATYALFVHDGVSGDVLGVIDLFEDAPEPGDLLVEPGTDYAWVTSMGQGKVVRIDLAAGQVDASWDVPSLRPRFLSYVPAAAGTSDPDYVYVAPMLSGNNSTLAINSEFAGMDARIVDLDTAAAGQGLPDEDLFRISTAPGGAIEPVARRVGTILTGHGRNPSDGQYWMLSVDLNNKDKDGLGIDTEPELNGTFAENELVLFPTPAAGAPLFDAGSSPLAARVALDDSPSGSFLDVASNPWDLLFLPAGAVPAAAVTSPTGDVVRFVAADGTRVTETVLPPGSIPRGMETISLPSGLQYLFVHCWGTNRVEIIQIAPGLPPATPTTAIDLELDPTPPSVRAGREIFYDAHRSFEARTTCGSCHVGAEYDGLAWPLSDEPRDHKDIMVTQNLKSIEDTFPYHWRGERDLPAFNEAFVGLLGGAAELDETPGGELDQFQDFVFSLQKHANPFEKIERHVFGDDATRGLDTFLTQNTVGVFTCVQCHGGPAGTLGEFVQNEGEIATKMHFEVAHLRDLSWKDEPEVTVNFVDPYTSLLTGDVLRSRSGFGVLHNGRFGNLFRLLEEFRKATVPPADPLDVVTDMTPTDRDDLVAFLQQFDTGTAPSTHAVARLVPGDLTQAGRAGLLVAQADKGWCGVVAFGSFLVGPSMQPVTLFYNTDTKLFEADLPSSFTTTLADIEFEVSNNGAEVVFVGTPAGNARALSVDRDRDGLLGALELTLHATDPNVADSDGDTWPDGYELDNGSDPNLAGSTPSDGQAPEASVTLLRTNVNQAVLRVTADEPCRYEVTWQAEADLAGEYIKTFATHDYVGEEIIALHGLMPASNFGGGIIEDQKHEVQVVAFDRSGNPSLTVELDVFPLPIQDGLPQQGPSTPGNPNPKRSVGVVKELCFTEAEDASGDLVATVRAKVVWQGGIVTDATAFPEVPLINWRIVAQVLVYDDVAGRWVVAGNTVSSHGDEFEVNGVPWDAIPGDYIVSPLTDSDGLTEILFTQPLASANQKVLFNIIAVARDEADVENPVPQTPELTNLAGWVFQATAPGLRSLEFSGAPGFEVPMCDGGTQ
ncbi:MAG: hypothetical protein AAF682_12325 [Planctomycetota bacterium]